MNGKKNHEGLSKIILAWFYLLKLVRFVRLPVSFATIKIFLPSVHILRQNLSVKVADGIEKLLDCIPCLFIPSTLLIDKYLMVLIGKQVELFMLIPDIKTIG